MTSHPTGRHTGLVLLAAAALAAVAVVAAPGLLEGGVGGGATNDTASEASRGSSSWSGHEDEVAVLALTVTTADATRLLFPAPGFVEVPEESFTLDRDARTVDISPEWTAPAWFPVDAWPAAYLVDDADEGARLFLASSGRFVLAVGGDPGPSGVSWPWEEDRWVVTLSVASTPEKMHFSIMPTHVTASGVTVGDYLLPCEAQVRHVRDAEAEGAFDTPQDVHFAYTMFPDDGFDLRFTGDVHPSADVEDAPCPDATVRFENLGLWEKPDVVQQAGN